MLFMELHRDRHCVPLRIVDLNGKLKIPLFIEAKACRRLKKLLKSFLTLNLSDDLITTQ